MASSDYCVVPPVLYSVCGSGTYSNALATRVVDLDLTSAPEWCYQVTVPTTFSGSTGATGAVRAVAGVEVYVREPLDDGTFAFSSVVDSMQLEGDITAAGEATSLTPALSGSLHRGIYRFKSVPSSSGSGSTTYQTRINVTAVPQYPAF